jgi:hypothetical protein
MASKKIRTLKVIFDFRCSFQRTVKYGICSSDLFPVFIWVRDTLFVIIRLILSVSFCSKVITLNGFYCIFKIEIEFLQRWFISWARPLHFSFWILASCQSAIVKIVKRDKKESSAILKFLLRRCSLSRIVLFWK